MIEKSLQNPLTAVKRGRNKKSITVIPNGYVSVVRMPIYGNTISKTVLYSILSSRVKPIDEVTKSGNLITIYCMSNHDFCFDGLRLSNSKVSLRIDNEDDLNNSATLIEELLNNFSNAIILVSAPVKRKLDALSSMRNYKDRIFCLDGKVKKKITNLLPKKRKPRNKNEQKCLYIYQ